jgi:Taurine catabolism dioxygenase TauD, TfdA family
MPEVIFDEYHYPSWTIDASKAKKISRKAPESHFYGHLADLINMIPNYSAISGNDWPRCLEGSVVVVSLRADTTFEPSLGGQPLFTSVEISQAVEFVRGGGSLFVIGECNIDQWGSNLNELCSQFGISMSNDAAMERSADHDFTYVRHITGTCAADHLITKGVEKISYHRGARILTRGDAVNLIASCSGHILAAATCFGDGRVVVVGDSDLFSIPYFGNADNAKFFVNAVEWLCGEEIKNKEEHLRDAFDRKYPFDDIDFHSQLTKGNTNCCIDIGPHAEGIFRDLSKIRENPYKEVEKFLFEAELKFHELPEEFRRRIIDFKRYGNDYGVLYIKGLPQDRILPPTPKNIHENWKSSYISEAVLSSVAMMLGDPLAYTQQHDGQLFHNTMPIKRDASEQSFSGSKAFLEFHTEITFHPFIPHFVLLYCIRQDHAGEAMTVCANVKHILHEMPIKYRSILFQERYLTGIDYSWGFQKKDKKVGKKCAILYGQVYDPFINYDIDLMTALDAEAEEALSAMKEAAAKVWNFVRLEPGDLLIIDNRRAIHGRSAFHAKYDGIDRWLQRMYVVRDLSLCNEERYRTGRTIDTAFYGVCEGE